MAKLSYNLWSTRKKMNPEKIVGLGVLSEDALNEFLGERNVQMPEDISEFERLWKAAQLASGDKKVEPALKRAKKVQESKPVKAQPKKTPRRTKTNIKDTAKEK